MKEVLPADAVEDISYGIPVFKLNDRYVIYFAGYSKHVSVYPVPGGSEAFEKMIAPYVKGRGTLQFKLSEPIPYNLIREVTDNALDAFKQRVKDY